MRRALIIVGVLAVVVVASWFAYDRLGKPKAAAAPDYETVAVERGDISSTVSATGSVLPEREANLNFQGSGMVKQVAVKVGDQVKTGQVLADLDTADLELAVRQAEVALRQAQAQVNQLKEGPNAVDLKAAQAALDSARSAYQQLLKGADADQVAAAKAQLDQARAALEQAQSAYDRVKDNPMIGMLPQSLQLQNATSSYEAAEANYRIATRRGQRLATGCGPGADCPSTVQPRSAQARPVGRTVGSRSGRGGSGSAWAGAGQAPAGQCTDHRAMGWRRDRGEPRRRGPGCTERARDPVGRCESVPS